MKTLETRFLEFSKQVILVCKDLPLDSVTKPIVSQLVRSATSIGTNYAESQSGISTKEFRAKISIPKKEAQETKYWLEL